MRILSGSRGAVLFSALMMALVLAVIASALARIASSRTLVFIEDRDRNYGSLAAGAAFAELYSCMAAPSAPSPVAGATPCAGWTAWASSSGNLLSTKTFPVSIRSYSVTATYNGAAQTFDTVATQL